MGWFSDLFSGKTQSTTTQPEWYTEAAKKAVDLSGRAADIGYVPYQGGDVAAFVPQQKEAIQGAQNRFTSFNNPGEPIPQVDFMPEQDFGGGLKGYSSFGGYQTEMAKLEAAYPGIATMLRSFSKSPFGAVGAPRPPIAPGPGSFGPTSTPPGPLPPVVPPVIPPVIPPVRPGRGGRPHVPPPPINNVRSRIRPHIAPPGNTGGLGLPGSRNIH